MIKRFFTLAMLAGACVAANAQLAKTGFESGDGKYKTEEGLTQGDGITFGDWVNVQGEDSWNEQCNDDSFTGEYSFCAENGGVGDEFTWNRGFKVGNLTLKEHTPYRISFWAKVDQPNAKMKAQLGLGFENFDCGILSPTSHSDIQAEITNFTGDWQHFSHVVYFTSMDVQNGVIDENSGYFRSWIGNGECPWGDFTDDTQTTRKTFLEQYNRKFPINKGFAIFNMYSHNATYLLDDIMVEEGVSFKEVSFNYDIVKFDFGYPTNIAALANASKDKVAHFDPASVTIKNGDQELTVEYLEGHTDGFLYAFVAEGQEFDEESQVTVSLNTPEEIVYNAEQRPMDYANGDADVKAVDVVNEKGYFDPNLDAAPSGFAAPELLSSIPESGSFNLDAATLNQVVATYDKTLDISTASATLKGPKGYEVSLNDAMSLGEDQTSIIFALPAGLKDGDYTLTVSNVANELGFENFEEQVITFSLGDVTGSGDVEVIFEDTFNDFTGPNYLPAGWSGNGDGYRESWDNTTTYSGAPRTMGGNYSGNIKKTAIYWCQRGGAGGAGELAYGKAALNYMNGDVVDEEHAPYAISLTPGKYTIAYKNACWDGKSGLTYNFYFRNIDGEDILAGAGEGLVPSETINNDNGNYTITPTEFTIEIANGGYYYAEFIATTSWDGFALGEFSIKSVPTSMAAFYIKKINTAIEEAQAVLDGISDPKYDGATKDALANEIAAAKATRFTSPSQVESGIAALQAKVAALNSRISNINNYATTVEAATTALSNLEGTKYVNTPEYKDSKAFVETYAAIDPSTLSDEELNEVVPQLTNMASVLANAKTVADVLAYRSTLAAELATLVGVKDTRVDQLVDAIDDDADLIDEVNALSKSKIYSLIGANGNKIPASLCTEVKHPENTLYSENYFDEETGDYMVGANGIELTSFIVNPKFYTVQTNTAQASNDTWNGWSVENINGAVHAQDNRAASAAERAVDTHPNSFESYYDVRQVVKNLPVGLYTIVFNTRTAARADDPSLPRNAQNEEGVWDMYIFANDNVAPFEAGSDWGGFATFVKEIAVGADGELTIGVHEEVLSGQGDDGNGTKWNTNTFFDYARIFMVGTDPTFDYANAATGIQNIENEKASTFGVKYNVAGQAVGADFKGVVIMNGKKYLAK